MRSASLAVAGVTAGIVRTGYDGCNQRGNSMSELTCNVPTPKTTQELEQAIQSYKSSDLDANELFCYWQAIRDGAIALMPKDLDRDLIAGDDSY